MTFSAFGRFGFGINQAFGFSRPPASVTPAPSVAPTGHFVIAGDATATLHWGTPPEGATSVVVERKTTGSYSRVTTATAGDGSYQDTGLSNGTTYTYRLSWSNATGAGPTSTEVVCVPWDEWKPLRGNESFAAASDLTPAARAWHDRITPYVSNPGSLTEFDDWSANDLYGLGRYFNRPITASIVALRLTGDLHYLDLADHGMQLARAELTDQGDDGTGSDGYVNWLYLHGTSADEDYNTDNAVMEEMLVHSMIAGYAWACQQNRDLTSPGNIDYGERADFWLAYLKDTFEPKWRDRNNKPTGLPFIGPWGIYHPDTRWALQYDWYMWRLTGDSAYKTQSDSWMDDLLADIVTVTENGVDHDLEPTGANTLKGRDPEVDDPIYWTLHGSGYATYVALDTFHAFCEGNPKITETRLANLAHSFANYVYDDPTAASAAKTIGGDQAKGGLTIRDGEARRTAGQVFDGTDKYLAHWDASGTIQRIGETSYNLEHSSVASINTQLALLSLYQMGDLPTPLNVTLTNQYTDASIAWTLPYDGGYDAWDNVLVYGGSTSGDLTLLATLDADVTSYIDEDVGTGTRYYQVSLKLGSDESWKTPEASVAIDSQPVTVNASIAAAADDWMVWNPYTAGYFNSDDGTDGTDADHIFFGKNYKAGLRFALNVPQGATITEAILTVTARNSRPAAGTIVVSAVDEDDAAAATDAASAAAQFAASTTASVSWVISEATVSDQEYSPPDLKAIIQEVVNRAGWQSGNHVVLLFLNSTDGASSLDSYPYEAWPDGVPTLSVTYTP